jgi:hypothetical protein
MSSWITNITHFLTDDGDLGPLPGPARKLAEFLLEIIETVVASGSAGTVNTGVRCRRRPGHKPCPGIVIARIRAGEDVIEWRCGECGDDGIITHWRSVTDSGLEQRRPHAAARRSPSRRENAGSDRQRNSAGDPGSRLPAIADRLDEIRRLTDAVSATSLNDEYAVLARKLAETLSRIKPTPLARGDADIWACSILYTLGTINFLFDKSQTPHLSADALCAAFNVKKSTAANKARIIQEMLDMFQLDPRWCLPSLIPDNPLVWMIEIDGFIHDIRTLPRPFQEEAFRLGLIPYIPADRKGR